MHTLSSASRTCMASASAVECTATAGMPSSLHARSTRSAISPRLAMRILSNITFTRHARPCARHPRLAYTKTQKTWMAGTSPAMTGGKGTASRSLDDHQRLAVFDRLTVLEQNLRHRAGARGGDLVERLHRLDDQQGVADRDRGADVDKGLGA